MHLYNYLNTSLSMFYIQNGALSAVPYICQAVCAFAGGQVADILRERGILTTTGARRLFELIGKWLVTLTSRRVDENF